MKLILPEANQEEDRVLSVKNTGDSPVQVDPLGITLSPGESLEAKVIQTGKEGSRGAGPR